MKLFYSDLFVISLPEGHRFPMEKYTLLRKRLAEQELVSSDDLRVPHAATDEEILLVHSSEYLERVKSGLLTSREMTEIGFPWSLALVERSRRSCGGTIEACRAALENALAVNLAGGTHHAFRDRGAGYCVFNDAAIATRVVQKEKRVNRVIIVDCDVHQGNGTADIFRADPSVYTFSIHGANNYPYRKEQSDLDVGLPDGIGDTSYLEALEEGLRGALHKARSELVIYLAGADPYQDDRFGRMRLTKEGLAARDQLVLEYCRRQGLPVAITMAGGYARFVADTVDIHFETVRRAGIVARLNLGT